MAYLQSSDGTRFVMGTSGLTIGRDEVNDVILPQDLRVSRSHAQIINRDRQWVLIDLGSKNGTLVNTRRVERHPLRNGDQIQIGEWIWQFQAGDDPFATEAAADSDSSDFYRMLRALPGVGPWTTAQVGHRAIGDADALPIGDYHLAAMTGWALAGRTIAEDEVEAFYEPWRPHRYRVVRLLELTPGTQPPRRGPRLSRQDYRRI